MAKKEMTNTESLCSIMLFFFQSGMDAASVINDGGGGLEINLPSDEDLAKLRKKTDVATWDSMMEVSEHLVKRIVETEPRNPADLARESVNVVRRGHELLQKLSNPNGLARSISDALGSRPKGSKK